MYCRETTDTNVTRFRHLRRPVLLVDHDREFGTLMRVAFESRGEHLGGGPTASATPCGYSQSTRTIP